MYPIYTQDFVTFFGTKITCLLRRGTIDFNVIQATTVDDTYNLKRISFNDGDVALDLGAYMGGVSLLLGSLASLNKNITVHAYEPVPENFELLSRNIKFNGFSNIFSHQLAISHKKGPMKIYYADLDTETGRVHHFVGGSTPSGQKYFEINATTIEEIFSENNIQRCKLIKTNIEGNEANILRGCPDDVLQRIDYIVGQHHDVTRKELLSCTRGLFEDIPNKYNTDVPLGVFWFKNVKI
jgi:FkbM family methyltransferase